MARISDTIEEFIKLLLKESKGPLDIQRNELADYFDCAPSQINYVLATRFSLDRGYYIESRRGGGGYIRILELDMDNHEYILYLITERIGDRISQQAGEDIIARMETQKIVNRREAAIMKFAIQDKAIAIPASLKDMLRANILKSMLTGVISLTNERG